MNELLVIRETIDGSSPARVSYDIGFKLAVGSNIFPGGYFPDELLKCKLNCIFNFSEIGHCLSRIDKKQCHALMTFDQQLLQFMLVVSVGFPQQAFDAIAIRSFFKLTGARTHAGL